MLGGRAQGLAAQMLAGLQRISATTDHLLAPQESQLLHERYWEPRGHLGLEGDSLCLAPISLQGLNKTWVHQSVSGSRKMRNCLFWAALRPGYAQWARLPGLRAELSGFLPCAFPPLPAQARFAFYETPLSVSLWLPYSQDPGWGCFCASPNSLLSSTCFHQIPFLRLKTHSHWFFHS